jgi:hypothetical protein
VNGGKPEAPPRAFPDLVGSRRARD